MRFLKLEPYVIKQTLIAACLNLAEIINGYGIGWTAPVIPKLRDANDTPLSNVISETDSTWVVSTIYFGVIGAYITSYVANKIGRRPCLLIGGILNIIAYSILVASTNIGMIYAGRLIVGLGISFSAVINMIYIGEIASPNIRGKILTSTGFFHALGSLIVYCIGPYASYAVLCYIAIGITLVYLAFIFYIPESPVYYVIKGNEEAAKSSLCLLGRMKDIDSELKLMMEKAKESELSAYVWQQIYTVKGNRRSLLVTIPLFFFQQSSGIIAIVAFTTTIFQDAGSSIEPDISTMIVGATMVIGTTFSPMCVEKYGRKILLIISTSGCCVSLTILGLYFYLDKMNYHSIASIRWLPLTSLVVALFCYSLGFNIIPQTIAGEMFSSNVRSLGSSISLSIGWLSGFISTTVFGYVVIALGRDASFWMFAIVDAVAFIFVIVVVPETKGKTLMEINVMMER